MASLEEQWAPFYKHADRAKELLSLAEEIVEDNESFADYPNSSLSNVIALAHAHAAMALVSAPGPSK
jgi:hypothetical protein